MVPSMTWEEEEQREGRMGAHRIICKPSFSLCLRIVTSHSHSLPIPSSFSFNSHPILPSLSLPSRTAITTTSNNKSSTQLWCSNYTTTTIEDGSAKKGYLELTDDELMRQCEMGTFRTSGPGGQHRNRRDSAVRLKHLPTGIVAQVYGHPFPSSLCASHQNIILIGSCIALHCCWFWLIPLSAVPFYRLLRIAPSTRIALPPWTAFVLVLLSKVRYSLAVPSSASWFLVSYASLCWKTC